MLKNNLIEKLLFGRAAENVLKRKIKKLITKNKIRHVLIYANQNQLNHFKKSC
jgi:hypothetical protein